jgi:hypothetical protein
MGCGGTKNVHDLAATGNHVDVVHILMRRPSLKNHTSKEYHGGTALHAAASTDQLECVQKLLALGCGLTDVDTDGNTVLHVAIQRGSEKVVKYLLSKRDPVSRNQIEHMLQHRNGKSETPKMVALGTQSPPLGPVFVALIEDFEEERRGQTQTNGTADSMNSFNDRESATALPDILDIVTTGNDVRAISKCFRRYGDRIFRKRLRATPWPFDGPAMHVALAFGQIDVAKEIALIVGEDQLDLLDAGYNNVMHTAVLRPKLFGKHDSLLDLIDTYPSRAKAMAMQTNDAGDRPIDGLEGATPETKSLLICLSRLTNDKSAPKVFN